jgi:hypothetical protein
LLVSAFLRGGLVVAGLVSNGKWTVVLSITLGGHGVVLVLSRVTRLGTILGFLVRWLSRREGREELGFTLDLGLGRGWQSSTTGLLGGSDGPVSWGSDRQFSQVSELGLPVRVLVTQGSAGEHRIRWVNAVVAHWRVGEVSEECVISGQI